MKRSCIYLAALASTALVGTARAADLVVLETPPPVQVIETVTSWSGIYLGIAGGYGITNDDVNVGLFVVETGPLAGEFGENIEIDGLSGDSWLAEGTIGGDLQIGNAFVLGALVDGYWFEADARASSGFNGDDGRFSERSVDIQRDWGFDALVRGGFLANDRTLVYALGGYSSANIDVEVEDSFDNSAAGGRCDPCLNRGSFDDQVDGWTVGAGVEALVTKALSIKAEYRYTEFEEIDGEVFFVEADGSLADESEGSFSIDPSQQTFKLGVNYRFAGMFN